MFRSLPKAVIAAAVTERSRWVPEASSPLGFEVVALQFWMGQYEAAHFEPSVHGH
jgi:hypothetical protein